VFSPLGYGGHRAVLVVGDRTQSKMEAPNRDHVVHSHFLTRDSLPHEQRTAARVNAPTPTFPMKTSSSSQIQTRTVSHCDRIGGTGQFKVTKAHPVTATLPDPKASFSIPETASFRRRRRPPGGWDLLRAPVPLFAANSTTQEIFNILPMRCLVRLLSLAFD